MDTMWGLLGLICVFIVCMSGLAVLTMLLDYLEQRRALQELYEVLRRRREGR